MADVFKKLYQGQLPTGAATLYTATGVPAIVKMARLVNTTANDVAGVQLFDGGTAAANAITGSFTLAAGNTLELALNATLAASGTIAGVAGTGTAITCTLYGLEL